MNATPFTEVLSTPRLHAGFQSFLLRSLLPETKAPCPLLP